MRPEESRASIERSITAFGATEFMYGWNGQSGVYAFRIGNHHVRFTISLPDPTSPDFTLTPQTRKPRSEAVAGQAHEAVVRERWQALATTIKSKLASVASGVSTIESEFLGQIVMPDGRVFAEHAVPRIVQAYDSGSPPELLPPCLTQERVA